MSANANIRGMTPEPDILMGITEDCPPYILLPFTCFAYCTGIFLSERSTVTMALISFLLIFLEKGAGEIASAYNLNDYASDIIAGIILFFILGSEFFINYRAVLRGHGHQEVRK